MMSLPAPVVIVSAPEPVNTVKFSKVPAGGAGNDSMDGGAGTSDTASYEVGASGGVKVSLAITAAQNTVGAGTDTLFNFENLTGTGFNDTLTGNTAANTLNGLAGNDGLNGGAGIDTLSGGAGNDRLIGGAGNDSLDGGAGTDSFVFDKAFGKDTVSGFVAAGAGHDTIDFSTSVFANFAAVKSHMVQSGANVVITLDAADTITLKGVTLASLTAADFTFHAGTAPAAPAPAAAAAVASWATHSAEANSHFHHG
jgi:Ca2+-binding RTX toxin-like protein